MKKIQSGFEYQISSISYRVKNQLQYKKEFIVGYDGATKQEFYSFKIIPPVSKKELMKYKKKIDYDFIFKLDKYSYMSLLVRAKDKVILRFNITALIRR